MPSAHTLQVISHAYTRTANEEKIREGINTNRNEILKGVIPIQTIDAALIVVHNSRHFSLSSFRAFFCCASSYTF